MKKLVHNMLTLGFVGYMVLLIYFLFFSEEYGRTTHYTDYQYNLTLFREISRYLKYRDVVGIDYFLINIVGNIVVFMPFGFFVPSIKTNKPGPIGGFLMISALGFLFSLAVETAQLITKVGCFDVDDLFLNTVGVALGYIGYGICHLIFGKRKKKRRKGH